MAKKLKVWNGASWEDVTFAITPPTTNVTNEFSTNQVIDASTSVAALRITQRGSGEAFRVEDSSTPDSSAFVIDTSGHVYVGSVNAASKIPTTRQYLNIGGLSGTGVLQLLDAGSNSALSGLIEFHDLQNTANVGGTRNAYIAAFVDGTTAVNNRGGRLDFATKQDGTSNAAVPRMTITNSGLVGIGTTTPTDQLHVNGNISAFSLHSTANNDSLELYASSTFNTNGDAAISIRGTQSGYNNGGMEFYAGGSERLRIASDGNVSLPNNKLLINSTLSVTGANWAESMLHVTGDSTAANNPSVSWHAPGASAMAMWHPRGSQALQIMGNSGVVSTGSGTMTIRNIAISTSNPSGGADGDMWAVYV